MIVKIVGLLDGCGLFAGDDGPGINAIDFIVGEWGFDEFRDCGEEIDGHERCFDDGSGFEFCRPLNQARNSDTTVPGCAF